MNYIAYGLLIFGAVFVLLAGVGLLRMPSFFMRMQATSKASTLGVLFMLVGLSLLLPEPELIMKAMLVCVFLILTTPVATHALALSAKRRDYDR
jgi:multicomponent Na+:H+ antiporter subunit G